MEITAVDPKQNAPALPPVVTSLTTKVPTFLQLEGVGIAAGAEQDRVVSPFDTLILEQE